MTKFQIVREDFKRQDTTNLMAIQLFDDNNLALTPNSSHTWQAKVVKGEKYAGEFSVNLRGNQIEVPAAQFTNLPSGEYGLELWETYDGKTTIYPSAGFVPFEIHRNAPEAVEVVDPTTNTQQLLQEMREAVKQIEFAEPIGVPAGNKPKVTQEIKNGKHIITLTLVQGERGPQGLQGIQGIRGQKGDTGERGPQGLTAYEVAQQVGFSGSKEEWLESLKGGPKGPKGDRGSTIWPTSTTTQEAVTLDNLYNNSAFQWGDDHPAVKKGDFVYFVAEYALAIIKEVKEDYNVAIIDLNSISYLQGPRGERGPVGEPGERGLQGEPGPAGPAGPNGITPTIGDNGNWYLGDEDTGKPSRGVRGPIGETGPQGIQGQKGDTGDRGPAGPAGANGITPTIGDNGNWYLGDEDTGKPSRGVQGPIGEAGPQGIQGQKGDTGDRGPAGPAGRTPVRGTDYWTTADQNTIKEWVTDAILNGKW